MKRTKRKQSGLLWPLFKANLKPYSVGFVALLIVDGLDLLPTLLIKEAIDSLSAQGPLAAVAALAMGYSLIVLVQGGFRYLWRIFIIGTSFRIDKELRGTLVQKIFRMRPEVVSGLSPGELMGHATQDVDAVRMAMGSGLLVGLDAILYLLLLPPLLFWLDAGLTLTVFAPMAVVPFFVYGFGKRVHARFGKVQAGFGRLSEVTRETLGAVLQVKLSLDPSVFASRFRAANVSFLKENIRLVRLQALMEPVLEGVGSLSLALLMCVGGIGVIKGDISLGTFVAFQRYIAMMVWPMVAIGWSSAVIQRGRASALRLLNVFGHPSEPNRAFDRELQFCSFLGLQAKALCFGYGRTPIFQGLDFTLGPKESVAIVGKVGSGKSSLMRLLSGVLEPESGVVLMNGVDIRSVNFFTRSKFLGLLDAEAVLFSMTLKENLTLGLDGEDFPSDSQIFEALRTAGMDQDWDAFPQGLETLIGEGGMTLSGGQRQRLALARALLRRPRVLILDDALSQLDYETEAKILGHLVSLGVSLILATNRFQSLGPFKRVLLLQEGRLIPLEPHAIAADGIEESNQGCLKGQKD